MPTSAAFALQRLARFYALSQQDALVRIINAAVDSLTAGMSDAERDQFDSELIFKPRKRKSESIITE